MELRGHARVWLVGAHGAAPPLQRARSGGAGRRDGLSRGGAVRATLAGAGPARALGDGGNHAPTRIMRVGDRAGGLVGQRAATGCIHLCRPLMDFWCGGRGFPAPRVRGPSQPPDSTIGRARERGWPVAHRHASDWPTAARVPTNPQAVASSGVQRGTLHRAGRQSVLCDKAEAVHHRLWRGVRDRVSGASHRQQQATEAWKTAHGRWNSTQLLPRSTADLISARVQTGRDRRPPILSNGPAYVAVRATGGPPRNRARTRHAGTQRRGAARHAPEQSRARGVQ